MSSKILFSWNLSPPIASSPITKISFQHILNELESNPINVKQDTSKYESPATEHMCMVTDHKEQQMQKIKLSRREFIQEGI